MAECLSEQSEQGVADSSPAIARKCNFCDRVYKSKGGLSKHVKLHHVEQWNKENGKISCDQCSAKLVLTPLYM